MADAPKLSEEEIKLRLIEAAAQTPAVRMFTDDQRASAAAQAMADVWYTNFIRPGSKKSEVKFLHRIRPGSLETPSAG